MKRQRSSNYSLREVEVLVNLVAEFPYTIECKKTDNVSNHNKEKAWKIVTEKFNETTGTGRSAEHLREKWNSLKKYIRRSISGKGSSLNESMKSVENKVLTIIGVSAINSYDCDSKEVDGDSETNQKGIYSIEKERLILSTVSTEDQRSLEDNNGIKTEPTELEWAEMELTQSELDNSEIGNDFIQQNPKDGESSSSSNENETIAFYQFKKRRAEKKCELLDLQLKLMKEEHERKMAFMIEKHELEMKLLKSQLEFYQWKSSHK